MRLDPDPAAHSLHNSLANGQSNSRPLEFLPPVQALEKDEDSFKVLRINSQAIVAPRKGPSVAVVSRSRDMYARVFGTTVLDRVPDEILKYLRQLRFICRDGGQRIVGYNRTALLDCCSQVYKRFLQRVLAGNLAEFPLICSCTRIGQQILDQPLHAVAPVYREGDELIGIGVEAPLVALGQQLRVTGHHPQRLLKIVG